MSVATSAGPRADVRGMSADIRANRDGGGLVVSLNLPT